MVLGNVAGFTKGSTKAWSSWRNSDQICSRMSRSLSSDKMPPCLSRPTSCLSSSRLLRTRPVDCWPLKKRSLTLYTARKSSCSISFETAGCIGSTAACCNTAMGSWTAMGSSGTMAPVPRVVLDCRRPCTSRRRLSISVGMSPTLCKQPTMSSVNRMSSRRMEAVDSAKSRCNSRRLSANSSARVLSSRTLSVTHGSTSGNPACLNSSRSTVFAASKSFRCTCKASVNES
mmetsp:Transcript_110533/g.219787  ORF Transcript_110533/g.219787 Transcript_110533/m.219787 type:complete len:230 (-) Transcript_110533:444-1133(-)